MTLLTAILGSVSFLVALFVTGLATRAGRRMNAMDGAGVQGQQKIGPRGVPNIGGVGIFAGFALVGVIVLLAQRVSFEGAGLYRVGEIVLVDAAWTPMALLALLLVHGIGLIDDRRALPWLPKLIAMLAIPAGLAWVSDVRVLTLADGAVGGAWLSILVTSLWFAVVMNAMNFMDNMDGLTGGVTAVIAGSLCVVAIVQDQWSVAAGAAVLAGAALGFLPHNFPRARVFMGDGGSLVAGFLLAYLTTRLTYLDSASPDPRWDRLAIPLVLLAVPLYDFTSVVLIRMSQGRSPFVGDLQHLSHRFERRGLSRPRVVCLIWVLTLISCIAAVVMARATPMQAALLIVQTACTLILLAAVERGMTSGASGARLP